MKAQKTNAKITLAILAAVLAYFVMTNHEMIRHTLVLLSQRKISWLLPQSSTCVDEQSFAKRSDKYQKCFTTWGNIHEFDAGHDPELTKTRLLQSVSAGCPILIKRPFRDDQCEARLKDISSTIDLKVKIQDKSIFDIDLQDKWFPRENKVALKSERWSLLNLFQEYEKGPSLLFSAFEVSMSSNDYAKVWGTDIKYLQGLHSSTFISNYNQTVISTPYHSAFWDSFAYQCQGTKKWRMMTPTDALQTVRFFGPAFTYMQDCNNRTDVDTLQFDVVGEPDSLFYFPPYWAHSVQTDAGLSILLNYRKSGLRSLLFHHPMMFFHTLVGLAMFVTVFESYDPDEVTSYYLHGIIPTGAKSKRSVDIGMFN